MAKIESTKTYSGQMLEKIFFRPMLSGPNAIDLGIKVMYNMPVPTTLQFWKRSGDILQKFTAGGWSGTTSSRKKKKSIALFKVKAEIGYSAADYFSTVFELITNRPDVNMEDLSGTELEEAETALFREAIAESIRTTMWLGDTNRSGSHNTFDGFIKRLTEDAGSGTNNIHKIDIPASFSDGSDPNAGENLLKSLWDSASDTLKACKSQGNLVYLVTSDIYTKYEEELDSASLEAAYLAKQNGRERLSYRGIPVIDVELSSYLEALTDMPKSFAILTDRRNLALAVNTADFPGAEIRMWYNPDLMENRQRAVFMAGCDYLLPELISFSASAVQTEP